MFAENSPSEDLRAFVLNFVNEFKPCSKEDYFGVNFV